MTPTSWRAVHVIDEAAMRETLDGRVAARTANGPRDSRRGVEHIEATDPPRLADLGVVASMQSSHSPAGGLFPVHAPGDLLRARPFETAFAWRAVRDTGAPLIFSTDWPVVPADPIATPSLPRPRRRTGRTRAKACATRSRR
ncbi:MAG: amidohydrolase family protein [Pseudomonadota bacterium]